MPIKQSLYGRPRNAFSHRCGGLKSVNLPHHTSPALCTRAFSFLTFSCFNVCLLSTHPCCFSIPDKSVYLWWAPGLPSALFIYLWLNLAGSLGERDTAVACSYEDTIHRFMSICVWEGGERGRETLGALLRGGTMNINFTFGFVLQSLIKVAIINILH